MQPMMIQKTEQVQTLSQQQILSLHIMEMSNYELMQYLDEMLLENPFIEIDRAQSEPSVYISEESEDGFQAKRYLSSGGDKELDPFESLLSCPTELSAAEYLSEQLQLGDQQPGDPVLMEYILELVDDNGYLRFSADEISCLTQKPIQSVRSHISLLQSLYPAGVGANNLQECLILQLKRLGSCSPEAETLIDFHLEEAAAHRFRKISAQTGIRVSRLIEIYEQIRALNPKPLNGIIGKKASAVVPDVILSVRSSAWQVSLNDNYVGTVRILSEYAGMNTSELAQEERQYFDDNLKKAAGLKRSVEKRRTTILQCARFIIEYQRDYIAGAAGFIRPLTLRQVAGALEMHESTVSRAIKNKYIQTPRGTFLIKELFSTGYENGAGAEQIKQRLLELIAREDRNAPYSDQKLSELLGQNGTSVSRRTVAKYRCELEIPNEWMRKRI